MDTTGTQINPITAIAIIVEAVIAFLFVFSWGGLRLLY
jgi:hypothetical protein